ncbi:MAG: PAS domain S-box protein, partial [Comamonas sp.]|nr:PAS domain S-box protein [Candidatus Comamonas equi]
MPKRMLAALRHPSLQLTIIAIVFVVLVPTLGVVTATLYSASRSYHESSTRQLLETARTVARSTLNELEMTGSMLQHLVQTQSVLTEGAAFTELDSIAHGQLQTFRVLRSDGGWHMQMPASTDAITAQLVEQAAQTGRMQVSDIVMPTQPGQAMRLIVAIPRLLSGEAMQVATLTTQPQHLLNALGRHGDNSTAVILALTDGQGRIIARSVDAERFIGKPVPDWDILSQQPGESGSLTAQTLEGEQIVFAFQRMADTPGWVAVVGESARSFNQRTQKPIWVMLAASAITICLALLLALLLARKALQPIRLLATRAQGIAAGQGRREQRLMADVPPSFVAEFEVLRQSLDQADQALQHSLQESRRAEQEAQEHLAVLQAAEEQAKLGHWTLDVKTGQLQCSDMISLLFGGPRQVTVLPMEALRHKLVPDSYERMRAAAALCLQHGTPYAMEVEHFRNDGSVFTAYLRGWPLKDAQAHIVGIGGTLQDISEGKEQHERLVALADNLPSGVIFRTERSAHQTLALQFLSAGLEQLTGFSASALLHNPQPLLQAIAPGHWRKLLRVLQRAQQPGQVLDQEFPLRTMT